MKNICIIDYDLSVIGGVEQVTASLSSALADYYQVHVLSLCMSKGTEPAYELDKRVHFKACTEKPERLRNMSKNLKPILIDYFRENNIDVAIIQETYAGILTSQTLRKTKARLIFADHGALMNQWDRKDMVFIRFISSVFCHKVVTLTEQNRKAYISKFLTPKRKISCIYNWVDLNIPRSDSYESNSNRIISAGRFGKEKGFDMLVKAFAPVAEKHPDWHLDIFGDGEMMETVKGLIAEYGISDNVHLMGMRTDLAKRYKNYAMYVLPSYREGMPLVLLEAKANRLPIVSFDILTGPREIVRDGIDGILVKPYDLQEMSDSICKLIENADIRKAFSDASQENLDKFSKETILHNWKNLIETI